MREISISAAKRGGFGKGPARQDRMAGRIPGVVYGPEVDAFSVTVDEKELRRALKTAGGTSSIFDLEVEGKHNKVVLRDLQRDPVTTKITHVDFHAISMTRPITISVPITFTGLARGVKTEGGIMQVTMRDLEISCLPVNIPDQIMVDVSDLGIGDSLHVRNISIPNVKILAPEQSTVVVIAAPTIVKEVAPVEPVEGEVVEAAEGEAAEAPAEGEKKEEAKKKEEPKKKEESKKKEEPKKE